MNRNEIKNEIINMMKNELSIDVDNVNYDSKLIDDLNLCSLDMMMLLSFIEKKYNKQFSVENLRNVITFDDLISNVIG